MIEVTIGPFTNASVATAVRLQNAHTGAAPATFAFQVTYQRMPSRPRTQPGQRHKGDRNTEIDEEKALEETPRYGTAVETEVGKLGRIPYVHRARSDGWTCEHELCQRRSGMDGRRKSEGGRGTE